MWHRKRQIDTSGRDLK